MYVGARTFREQLQKKKNFFYFKFTFTILLTIFEVIITVCKIWVSQVITLMMKTVSISETSVYVHEIPLRTIPEGCYIYWHGLFYCLLDWLLTKVLFLAYTNWKSHIERARIVTLCIRFLAYFFVPAKDSDFSNHVASNTDTQYKIIFLYAYVIARRLTNAVFLCHISTNTSAADLSSWF
jgi:hypothetical protein